MTTPLSSPNLLQALENSIPAIFYQFLLRPDRSESFHYISPAAAEIFELPLEVIKEDAQSVLALIHPADRDQHQEAVALSEKTMQSLSWEGRYVMRSGNVKWLKVYSTPHRMEDGSILWSGFVTDVTEQKESSAQLQLLRELINRSADAIHVMDAEGTFIFVNAEAASRLGLQEEEILGQQIQHLPSQPLQNCSWQELVTSLKGLRETLVKGIQRRPDGSTFPVEVKAKYVEVQGKGFVVAFSRDITDRTLAEARLQATDQLLRGANEAASILLTEEDFRAALQKALTLIGTSADVDRVYLFQNHFGPDGTPYLSQKQEWVKDNISVQLDNPDLQNIPYVAGGLKRWYDRSPRKSP